MQYFRCCRSLFSKLTSKVTWEGGACTQDASWLIAILRIEAPIYANCPHTITLTNPHCLGYWTCDARAQNGARKDFLGMCHSLLSHLFFYFLCPASVSILWRTCVYIHISYCIEIVYDLPLLPNNTACETFSHKFGDVQNVDWIFITGAPAWRWLGERMTLDKMF